MKSWQYSETLSEDRLKDSIRKKNESAKAILNQLHKRCDYGHGKAYTYDSLSMPLNANDELAGKIRQVMKKGIARETLQDVARSLHKDDYIQLGQRCGYVYKGVQDNSSCSWDPDRIPDTFFHSTANWVPVATLSTTQN